MIRAASIATVPWGLSLAGVMFALGLVAGSAIGPVLGSGFSAPSRVPAKPVNLRQPVSGAHPAELVRVIDGDTFAARVAVWPGIGITTKVRLRGIDAPEMHARCPQERSQAEAARDALHSLLAEGGIAITRVSLGKYAGRVLADAATRTTPDVSAAMLAAGLARPYRGGRRKPWCGGS